MSSIGKTPSSTEESGWTNYFDEFFSNKKNDNNGDDDEDHNNNNKCCYSSVLISDAASSSAAKRFSNYNNEKPHEREFLPLKRKNFKTALLDDVDNDDSLQDTATSPLITTSKVFYGNQFEEQKQTEDLEEKCSNIEQRVERKELLDFNGRYDDDGCTNTELIKEEKPLLNINYSFVCGS